MDDFDEEGNAAELKFGKGFSADGEDRAGFLMNDEVFVLLERTHSKGLTQNEYDTLQFIQLNNILYEELSRKPFSTPLGWLRQRIRPY
jgi:hypothetical protein